MNLSLGLAQVARRSPDNPAILWPGGALSYGGFEDQVGRIAGALRDRHGLRPGARIGMAMENSAEFLPVLYGIWRAGMTAIPINAKLHPRELAWILESAGAPLCIATPKQADALGGIAGIPPIVSTGSADYAALLAGDPVTRVASRPDDPAWIFYTSGTTGRPKGAMVTHRMVLFNAINCAVAVRVTSASAGLTYLPTFHIGGLNLYANPLFHTGGAVHVMRTFEPGAALDYLADTANGITHNYGVPTNFLFISQEPGFAGADLVDRLVHLLHKMKPVQHVDRTAGFFGNHFQVRLPHVAAHEL